MADERWLSKIVAYCHDMRSDERLKVFCFGNSKEVNLSITKDANNRVNISATRLDKPIGAVENINVADGSLYNELARIWTKEII